MPKLWEHSIQAHREAVREAVLDATWTLVAERGLTGVTMSQVAERAGIGRATLYKHFPDAEAILHAWHQRQIARHLAHLVEVGERATTARERLEAVLNAYASVVRDHNDSDLAAWLHRDEHVVAARKQLTDFIRDLLAAAAAEGEVRDDISPRELASYCLHALGAAGTLRSAAAARRLVSVTLTGLRPQR